MSDKIPTKKPNCDDCIHSFMWETSHEWLDLVCGLQKKKPCNECDATNCEHFQKAK